MTSDDIHRLRQETWIASVEYHHVLSSTNDRAAELAKSANTKMPLLVIADTQTAGRGRGGNRWWTGTGSLALSVLFDLQSSTALTGLAAALAILETIRPLLDGREIGLYWPNDVFAASRKLAGILVEVLPDRKTILGIGVNVNNSIASAPSELQSVATTLYDLTQNRYDRTSILITILNHLKRYLALSQEAPERLAAAADAACLQKNQPLHLQWGQQVYSGQCRGIDSSGALLLETGEGLQSFPSGVILKS